MIKYRRLYYASTNVGIDVNRLSHEVSYILPDKSAVLYHYVFK